MKALLIINPKAGRRRNRRHTAEYLRRAFELHGYDCDIIATKKPREAERIAHSMAEKYDLVVCSGGDGTLNETVNGLTGLENCPPLAYLPTGTTNDFAGSLGLSTDVAQAIRDTFDGAFSESSYQTPQKMKNRFGRLAYVLESLRELPAMKSHRMKIYGAQGEICRGSYLFGAVSNATSIGGILHYDRGDISLSDGKHEVLLIKKPESLGMLRRTVRALITGNYAVDGIQTFHTSHVRFESEDETAWTLDGERCEPTKSIAIDNIHSAMEFIIPPACRGSRCGFGEVGLAKRRLNAAL